MILFIFEGAKYEPPLYKGIKALFFPRSDDQVLCSFCSSIYTFYKRLKDDFDGFGDVVDILKEEKEKTDPNNEIFKYKSSDFESIYLFFDYDFYWGDIATKNAQVIELLKYFNEETENGKLFIIALLGCGWPPHKTWKWSDARSLLSYGCFKRE